MKLNGKKLPARIPFPIVPSQECEGFCAGDINQSVSQGNNKNALSWRVSVGGSTPGFHGTLAPVLWGAKASQSLGGEMGLEAVTE